MENTAKYIASDNCPTQQQLSNYSFAKLPSDENYQVERHINNCKICSDVVDGLMELKSENELIYSSNIINKKISSKLNNQSKKYFIALSIAASLALLIGVSVFFINTQNNKLVENNINNESTLLPNKVASDSSNSVGGNQNILNDNPVVENTINDTAIATESNAVVTEEMKAPVAAAEQTNDDATFEDLPAAKQAENVDKEVKNIPINDAVKSQSLSLPSNANTNYNYTATGTNNTPPSEFQTIATVKKPKKENKKDSDDNAKYKAEAEAKVKAESDGAENARMDLDNKRKGLDKPMNDEAIAKSNYLSGIHFYQQKNYEKALQCFDKTIQYPETKYFEDAQWQKAKALIDMQRITDAKKLLNQIINAGGIHKIDAKEELEKQ